MCVWVGLFCLEGDEFELQDGYVRAEDDFDKKNHYIINAEQKILCYIITEYMWVTS